MPHKIREIDHTNQEDVATVSRLHLELLGHGPMARLGELFLRRFCYTVLLRDDLMKAALSEMNGSPAGFVAYTARSIAFHRSAIRSHFHYVAFLVLLSIIREPQVILRLPKAASLMFSRRAEKELGQDPLAEILAIGVLPEYRTPQFTRRTGLKISQELIVHVVSYFRSLGLDRMRMVVEADNKPALFFYHSLGARFEPYEQAGEPMVQCWLNLDNAIV